MYRMHTEGREAQLYDCVVGPSHNVHVMLKYGFNGLELCDDVIRKRAALNTVL